MSQIKINQNGHKLSISVDTRNLTAGQLRLIKTINALLLDVATTDDENIFFNHSAELLRKCASIIQQSKFTKDNEHLSEIPYAEQVLEYSFEVLQEQMTSSDIISYDN